MPITYSIDPIRSLVRVRIWGVLTAAELQDHYARLAADPAFDPTFSRLTDARDTERFDATSGEVQHAAEGHLFAAGVRRAIVVATDYQFGMARMFSTFASNIEQQVEVFRDLEDAEAWLTA
jgi:hypothetical protein